MKIFDVHCHVYPDAIAKRAADSIGEFYQLNMHMSGTLSDLLSRGQAAGISRFVINSAAVTASRVHSINDFLIQAAASDPEHLVGFGTMHPDYENIGGELDRIRQNGLLGVKLHPDFQHFCLDDSKAIAMFEALAERGLPALIHTGDHRYPYSEPARMAKVLDKVPGLKVICAHLGGWSVWTEAWKELAGRPGVWVDTSSSLYAITPEEGAQIIHRYGVDRVFFGTDYPMWAPDDELKRFMALPLTDEEREKILHANLEQFLASLK
ncbi:MAG: amidohydrolase [Clostridia bacterium]|nr:amidohydrolase [Clostridia bacterium]